MKKGISLIVLVITIIVMVIIAGAIIISLNGTNIVNRAEAAVVASDVANLKAELTLEYAEIMAQNHQDVDPSNDIDKSAADQRYQDIIARYTELTEAGYKVTTNTDLTFTVSKTTGA